MVAPVNGPPVAPLVRSTVLLVPALMVKVKDWAVALDPTTVRSVAVLLPPLTSPPPDTMAVLVTVDGALAATLTVSVIAG
jgi:hypothetical protein